MRDKDTISRDIGDIGEGLWQGQIRDVARTSRDNWSSLMVRQCTDCNPTPLHWWTILGSGGITQS